MLICLLVWANVLLLPFFCVLFYDDGPLGGRALEDSASVEGVEEFPLNTTLLLPSDVLMTKFSFEH